MISLPASESTVRGFSADLLILDEASRIDDDSTPLCVRCSRSRVGA